MRTKIVFLALLFCLAANPAMGMDARKIKTGLSSPVGMAMDKNGALYVAEMGANRARHFQKDGEETAINGVSGPAGIALDGSGSIYISGYGDGNIYAWDTGHGLRKIASGFLEPAGLLWNEIDQSLYVADRGRGEVARLDRAAQKHVFSRGHNLPVGIARTSGGDFYISCYGGSIDVLDAAGREKGKITALERPGAGIMAIGDTIYAVDNGAGSVVRIDKMGNVATMDSGFASPVGLLAKPDKLLISCWGDGTIREIDIEENK